MRTSFFCSLWRSLAAALVVCLASAGARADGGPVHVVEMSGAIGVATSHHLERALREAQAAEAQLVVIKLDTPGGLVTSTRRIIQAMLASPVPVAVYVAPSGARAASAGTYIAYAAQIAAMAPGTNLGAATPISLGGGGSLPGPSRKDGKDKDAAPADNAAEHKVVNDAVAFIRSLAQLQHRNADWAERAVREAATLTAQDAVREHVVDLVAADVADLLRQIDGRRVMAGGREHVLATKGAAIVAVPLDWWTGILAVITDPNIAYLLLLAGIYGLIFEFVSPGTVLPGIVGGISLLLALGALTVLPVNYAGLALILLGVALMVAEAFTPGVIALGIGGVVAFIAGALFLFEPGMFDGSFAIAWPVIAATAAVSAGFLIFVIGAALRARRRPLVSGDRDLIGSAAQIVDWTGGAGHVRLRGELWSARSTRDFRPGEAVRIAGRDGLKLIVEPDRGGSSP